MRNTDERKWDDRWFRQLSPESKVLYGYLGDTCDCGGFLEYDPELWAFRTGMSLDEVEKAWKPLLESGKAQRWVKDGSSMGHDRVIGGIVWVKNAVKIQLAGKELDTANRFHRGIYRKLKTHLDKFPEIQGSYMAHARVINDPSMPLPRGYGKGKGKGILEGECEGDVISVHEGSEHPVYSMLIAAGLNKTCSYVTFRQLERAHPELDWEALVQHVVMTHENDVNGVRNAYTFLAALAQKGKFPKGAGSGPAKKSPKQEKVAEIEARWAAGEITDEECQKQIAEVK